MDISQMLTIAGSFTIFLVVATIIANIFTWRHQHALYLACFLSSLATMTIGVVAETSDEMIGIFFASAIISFVIYLFTQRKGT